MRSAEMTCARRALAGALLALSALIAGCQSAKPPPPAKTAEADPMRAKLRTPNQVIQPERRPQAPTPEPARTKPPVAVAEVEPPKPAPKPEPVLAPVDANVQRAFDAARQQLAAGRLAEAERGFVALVQSHPDLAGPHANLGLVHRKAGKLPEAAAALERAVALSPRADLYNQLGITYRMAGRFGDARGAYEKAIEIEPEHKLALLNLGILLDLYLSDPARALALYERYMALAGNDDNVKKWISDLRNRNPQKSAVAQKEQQ